MSDLQTVGIADLAETVSALALQIELDARRDDPPMTAAMLAQASQALEQAGLRLCAVPGLVGVGAGLIATAEALGEVMERRPWPAPAPATV